MTRRLPPGRRSCPPPGEIWRRPFCAGRGQRRLRLSHPREHMARTTLIPTAICSPEHRFVMKLCDIVFSIPCASVSRPTRTPCGCRPRRLCPRRRYCSRHRSPLPCDRHRHRHPPPTGRMAPARVSEYRCDVALMAAHVPL